MEGTANANKITNDYYIKLINNIKNSGQIFDKIMSNYYFLDDKNEPISYKYLGADASKTSILNKICESKRCPIEIRTSSTPAHVTYKKADINPNYIYQKNINLDSIYNIYLSNGVKELKLNADIFKEYQKNKDSATSNNYSYPFIGGYYYNKPFSLFGSPFYYNQAANFNSTENKNIQVSDFHKALLFLNTLDVKTNEIESLFLNNKNISNYNENNFLNRTSFMARIPKSAILLVGATLWRFKYNKLYPFLSYENTKIPDIDQYFKVKGVFTLRTNDNLTTEYDTSNLFFKRKNGNYQSIFNPTEEEFLIKEFTNWAILEWPKIRNQFELKIKTKNVDTNNSVIGVKFLTSLINTDITDKYLIDNINNISTYINVSNTNFIKSAYESNQLLNNLILINKDDTIGVKTIINLLLTDCVLAYSGNNQNNDIPKTNSMQIQMLGQINNNIGSLKNPEVSEALGITLKTPNKIGIESIDYNPDMNLAVYSYLKTINDKWVSGFSSPNEYQWITNKNDKKQNVSQFKALPETDSGYYIRNFRFIDRAHNDIGIDMLINYRQLFEIIDANTSQKTLFSAMTDVLQQNQMLFLPMPSYQSFDNAKDFSNIFKPIPFIESKMMNHDPDYDSSMYLCMYAGRPSSKLDQGNNSRYSNDSYPLNDPKDLPNDYLSIKPDQAQVPAIAVNFGQQNQQYFKNMSLNMTNPNTTDASIKVLQNLNERANQNATIEPIGQDLFSLYSQYSYSCEVEMMGCPQIQPMMYFQLNNTHMWNGAYMIFKIKHSIKPGTMTTNFTGMRMAKTYPKLISQNAVSFKLLGNLENYSDFTVPIEDKSDGGNKIPNITVYNEKFIPASDHFLVKEYFKDKLKSNIITGKIYNRVSYLSQVVEKIYSEWTALSQPSFGINSGYRDIIKNDNENSPHLMGLAVDIQIPTNKSKGLQESLFSYIQTMMSKGLPVDQLILETENNNTYWIHIGLARHTKNNNEGPIIVGARYNTRGLVCTHNAISDGTKYPELTKVSEAMWPNQSIGNLDSTKLAGIQNINQRLIIDYLKGKSLSKVQVAGVMGNIMQESKFKLDYPNGNASTGLIHWATGSYGNTLADIRTKIGSTVNSQLNYLTNGSTFGYSNWITQTNNITDIYKATELFSKLVEKPGNPQNEKRGIYANEILQRLNDPNDYLHWS